jgi:hypothetical protein
MATVTLKDGNVVILEGEREIPTTFTPEALFDLPAWKQVDKGDITAVGDPVRIRLYFPDNQGHTGKTSVSRDTLAIWAGKLQPEMAHAPNPLTEPE